LISCSQSKGLIFPSIKAEEKGVLVLALVSILLLSGLTYIWFHERTKSLNDPENNMVAVINIEAPYSPPLAPE
jgi:hypothetical protein